MNNLGKNITFYRKQNKITQKELSEKLNISNVILSRYEKGIVFPRKNILEKICKVFNISLEELMADNLEINTINENIEKLTSEDLKIINIFIDNLLKNNIENNLYSKIISELKEIKTEIKEIKEKMKFD